MNNKIRSACIVTCVVLAGCASQVLEDKSFRSYTVGDTKTATIGEAFLVDQTGYIKKVKKWVGILASPDGWETKDEYSEDYLRRCQVFCVPGSRFVIS
jgi:hypothetical protein